MISNSLDNPVFPPPGGVSQDLSGRLYDHRGRVVVDELRENENSNNQWDDDDQPEFKKERIDSKQAIVMSSDERNDCEKCGRKHPGECRMGSHGCYRCGKGGKFDYIDMISTDDLGQDVLVEMLKSLGYQIEMVYYFNFKLPLDKGLRHLEQEQQVEAEFSDHLFHFEIGSDNEDRKESDKKHVRTIDEIDDESFVTLVDILNDDCQDNEQHVDDQREDNNSDENLHIDPDNFESKSENAEDSEIDEDNENDEESENDEDFMANSDDMKEDHERKMEEFRACVSLDGYQEVENNSMDEDGLNIEFDDFESKSENEDNVSSLERTLKHIRQKNKVKELTASPFYDNLLMTRSR
ncbi:hypothetical protein QVD17_19904 [Tagetes erecta]|uniref:Uncharacterized protein n=1 Tax=Tagetes erecta TaxID=13708 RepID=A0AAD8KNW8_TARER|nr:hypothetical protein QVD17_19904 [Tagetes erecta]